MIDDDVLNAYLFATEVAMHACVQWVFYVFDWSRVCVCRHRVHVLKIWRGMELVVVHTDNLSSTVVIVLGKYHKKSGRIFFKGCGK